MLTVRRTLGTSSDSLPWMSTNESLTWEGEYEYQYASATSPAAAVAAAYLDAPPALAQVTSATTKQMTTGIAPPNTGATGISVMGGVALLGRATGAVRAAILIGDSIADGTNDTQSPQPTRHGNGIFGRGIADANGVPAGGAREVHQVGRPGAVVRGRQRLPPHPHPLRQRRHRGVRHQRHRGRPHLRAGLRRPEDDLGALQGAGGEVGGAGDHPAQDHLHGRLRHHRQPDAGRPASSPAACATS